MRELRKMPKDRRKRDPFKSRAENFVRKYLQGRGFETIGRDKREIHVSRGRRRKGLVLKKFDHYSKLHTALWRLQAYFSAKGLPKHYSFIAPKMTIVMRANKNLAVQQYYNKPSVEELLGYLRSRTPGKWKEVIEPSKEGQKLCEQLVNGLIQKSKPIDSVSFQKELIKKIERAAGEFNKDCKNMNILEANTDFDLYSNTVVLGFTKVGKARLSLVDL